MKKALLLSAFSLALLVSPLAVFAQTTFPGGGAVPTTFPGGGQPSNSGGSHQVVNPLGVTSVCGLIKALLGAAIAIGIPIAVLFIVWAGLKFVLARGKAEDLAAARTNFLYTVIGIGIFLGAWLLASVIANTINALQAGSGQANITSCM